MKNIKLLIVTAISATTLSACGGGSSSAPTPTPPAAAASTFSVTLTAVEVRRSADQQLLDVAGLPARGATVRLTD